MKGLGRGSVLPAVSTSAAGIDDCIAIVLRHAIVVVQNDGIAPCARPARQAREV